MPFFPLDKKQEELRIENGVKEMYTYKLDIEEKKPVLIKTIYYNKLGKYIKSVSHNRNGEVKNETLYEYNANERIEIQRSYNKEGLIGYTKYEFDADGNRINYYQYGSNNELYVHQKRLYNTRGLNAELYDRHENNFYLSQRYNYNSIDQLIEIEEFDESGLLELKSKIEYDEKRNRVRWFYDFLDGNKKLIVVYRYDDMNNLIQIESFAAFHKIVDYKYNNRNLLIEENTIQKNELVEKKLYKYKYT